MNTSSNLWGNQYHPFYRKLRSQLYNSVLLKTQTLSNEVTTLCRNVGFRLRNEAVAYPRQTNPQVQRYKNLNCLCNCTKRSQKPPKQRVFRKLWVHLEILGDHKANVVLWIQHVCSRAQNLIARASGNCACLLMYVGINKGRGQRSRYSSKLRPVAKRSQARVCGRSLAGIAGSNPAGVMDDCVLCVLYSKGQKAKSGQTSTDKVQRTKENPTRGEIFRTRPDPPWSPHSLL